MHVCIATMDQRHKDILRKLQRTIVRDLTITDIIDTLLSKGMVSLPLWDEIQNENNYESQNRKLLDNLPRRGPEAYSIFKESLRENYSWISEEMDTLENTEDCVDFPDIPQSHLPANPPLSVKREHKMAKLRQGLTNLEPGNYLVLHALQGYGKSTLASATLRDKNLVSELFENEIYWIKFDQFQSISDTILKQLNLLFHLVRNLDPLSEPTSEESLKYSLRRHFSERNQALIILDDVSSSEVIKAFDFGCKTLVLTTDVEILQGKQINVIEMSDGFSANESLNLFAKATGIPVSDLPKQARQIHEICEGMPLTISMLSAQFEDIKESLANGQMSNEIWSYYLDALRERKSDLLQQSLERRAAIFNLCIEKLSQCDQDYFKTLAIFPEDVNIPTKTLSIYWGMPLAEVDSRMLRFCKKSLACRKWHENFDTYVYGVHNLVLCHLRDNLSCSDLKKWHKLYVQKNFESCHSDFSKLPKDNYVHSYIGYHMEKGGLSNKFSELYLDFGFIESKVFHVGPGDLLIDLKKYKNFITSDSISLSESVEDLEKFLIHQASTLAEYRRRNCLDLVQVALKHPIHGFVRKTAETLASARRNSLYLNHLNLNAEHSDSFSEELHLQVSCVAFVNEPDAILVGNDKGKVILWNCLNRQQVPYYGNDNNQPITKIIVASGKENFFICISGTGIAKLFRLRGEFIKQKNNERIKTLHPRAKQPSWINMSESKFNQDDSRITFSIIGHKILDIAIGRDERKIAGCTSAGTVAIWDYDGQLLVQLQSAKEALTSIAFSTRDTLLHAANLSTGSLLILDASNGHYKSQFSLHPESDKIISLLSVPQYNNLLVVLVETKVYRVSWALDGGSPQGLQTIIFARLGERGNTYTCAAVTKDGKYIITADSSGSVNVCDLHEGLKILKTYKTLVSTLDTTYWPDDRSYHVICGGNRDILVPMVHKWKFDPKEKPVVRRLALFDATMEPEERNVMAVATSNGTVQIIQNDDVIAETDPVVEKITSLLVFDNGNHVVYATEKGTVFLFDVKLNHSKLIMELSKSVKFMTVLNINNEDVIVCEEGYENLQIWKSSTDAQLVEYSGSVIFCDIIKSVNHILTVAEKVLKIWDPNTWKLQSKYEVKTLQPSIRRCSLSPKQNYLALTNATGNLNILKIIPCENIPYIRFQEFAELKFNETITACNFSQDEQFLALGFKNGEINIIGMQNKSVIRKLELHRKEVKELYWGPGDLDEPILLSLANELAWWSVATKLKKEPQKEIMSQSLNALTISPFSQNSKASGNLEGKQTMKISKSIELGNISGQMMENIKSLNNTNRISSVSDNEFESYSSESNSDFNLQHSLSSIESIEARENNTVGKFWNEKKPKFSKIPGLLSVVKLESGDASKKVCVSKDFSYFVTLTGGSIYNLRILDDLKNQEIGNGNGNA